MRPIKFPTYVAVDIARLPPVDVEHLDVTALLKEMMLLRSKVRSIGSLQEELDEVKSQLKAVQAQQPAVALGGTHMYPLGKDSQEEGFTTVQGKKKTVSYAVKATNRAMKSVDTVRHITEVQCQKLKYKYEDLYSSLAAPPLDPSLYLALRARRWLRIAK